MTNCCKAAYHTYSLREVVRNCTKLTRSLLTHGMQEEIGRMVLVTGFRMTAQHVLEAGDRRKK